MSRNEDVCPSVDGIFASMRELGLVAVRLEENPADDDSSFWPFQGSLNEFLAVVKDMGSKAIYVVSYTFDEDWFRFSLEEEEEEDEFLDDGQDEDEERLAGDATPETIDLVEFEPNFEHYRSRIGETHTVCLLALTGESKLSLEISADWYRDFSSLLESVVAKLRASRAVRERAQESAKEKRLETERTNLMQALEGLPSDTRFRDLRTKGAMTAYVNEHFPRAKELLGISGFRDKLTDLHHRAQLERDRR